MGWFGPEILDQLRESTGYVDYRANYAKNIADLFFAGLEEAFFWNFLFLAYYML